MEQRDTEIAVVGGSAAGLFAAYLLARQHHQVVVLEGAERFDPAPRALIATHRFRELLGNLGDKAVVNEIHRFELHADGQVATVTLRHPDVMVERATLLCALADRATAAGAQLMLGHWVRSLEPHAAGITLHTQRTAKHEGRALRAGTVIGADGAFSKVARAAGWPPQPTLPLVQALVRLPADLPSDTARVWFLPQDTPYFYWLLPLTPEAGVLGLIGEEGRRTRQCLLRFLARQGLQPLGFQGARVPLYRRWVPVRRQFGGGQVYLVGDAAAQVKVTTVGGLVTGLRGALGVAEAIAQGGASRELRALRRELNLHRLTRGVLHRFSQRDYASLLGLLHAGARRSLGTYTRDEALRVLWRLCCQQPRLLLLALRALLLGGSPAEPKRSAAE
ncbi:MAG: hypothetical protein KatS3mg131_0771 [Candidatus Tectimicrobiota bacterium]|nr:MAG: hypothetical protein KatS3mg131_0771 [Candidatus Tectomicrobia bacterium]